MTRSRKQIHYLHSKFNYLKIGNQNSHYSTVGNLVMHWSNLMIHVQIKIDSYYYE